MSISWSEIHTRALEFSKRWADAHSERKESIPFWMDFFHIFDITNKRVAIFEHNVTKLDGLQGRVDLFWPGMMLVEHKSLGENLDKAFAEALEYVNGIAERDLPKLLVVCDFQQFRVRNLTGGDDLSFKLSQLHKHIKYFGLLVGYQMQAIRPEDPVNIKAAERMGQLHDQLKALGYSGHELEVLLVRLLFCLFSDDTGIFQPSQSFRDVLSERTADDASDLGAWLARIFQVLNTPEDKSSAALDPQLAAFPYVNGRLFAEALPMADFTPGLRAALLQACALDWAAISPAIFGSLFQSIMDEDMRRHLGAHYTSEANILKLIQPLFLDELQAEFERIKNNRHRLLEFHQKLRTLTFLDPACGCGNFLVISYRELRLLELQVLRAAHDLGEHKGQLTLDVHNLIGVNVDQFYGIEIEEFPAQIAQVALWLVDHQMNLRVSEEFGKYFARIPLVASPQIRHANALRLDWDQVLPANQCSVVMGNPPFHGYSIRSKEQQADMARVMSDLHGAGVLDLVCAWYVLAAKYMQQAKHHHDSVLGLVDTQPTVESATSLGLAAKSTVPRTGTEPDIPRCGFVSTNSVVQGEQVGVLWSYLQSQAVQIHFAHRSFKWSNEARGKAAVHCVIIGFGLQDKRPKQLFYYETVTGEPLMTLVNQINPYLVDAPTVLLEKRRSPISQVPEMVYGSKPTDGGHLLLSDVEKEELLDQEPQAADWIRPFVGAEEFINGIKRWCLWLVDCPPQTLRKMPLVMKRVLAVKEMRLASPKKPTQVLANMPSVFGENRQPSMGNYLLVPLHSSENRAFIPIGFCDASVVCGNANALVADASLYHFGIMTSSMHNAWMRTVCGRLGSSYRYSANIVYNNFPWPAVAADAPTGTPAHKLHAAIEQAAQAVLDARAQYQQGEHAATLADLYDPTTMPAALLRAHQLLDAAVDKAYAQTCGGAASYKTDADRVAFLFMLYQRYTSLLSAQGVKSGRNHT